MAVTSARPSVLLPDLPTVAETVPGYEAVSILAMFAPAKTSASTIRFLNEKIVQTLVRDDMRQKFSNLGSEVVASSPGALGDAMKAEMTRIGKVIKDAGIKAE